MNIRRLKSKRQIESELLDRKIIVDDMHFNAVSSFSTVTNESPSCMNIKFFSIFSLL